MAANLTWSDHTKNIKAKASQTLGYIRRNLKASPSHVKNMACNTYIRSKLEYAASVWNPHQIYLINNLESVQNRAARFTLFEYDRTTSVSALKNQLNLPPLQVHRKIARLSALHKITIIILRLATPYCVLPSDHRPDKGILEQSPVYLVARTHSTTVSFPRQLSTGTTCLMP